MMCPAAAARLAVEARQHREATDTQVVETVHLRIVSFQQETPLWNPYPMPMLSASSKPKGQPQAARRRSRHKELRGNAVGGPGARMPRYNNSTGTRALALPRNTRVKCPLANFAKQEYDSKLDRGDLPKPGQTHPGSLAP